MLVWKIIFWISCFIIFYNYLGYALLIFMINKLKGRGKKNKEEFFPTVSFIVAAYNEEDCIEKKILNSFDQDYPPEKIEFLFITDGSTDRTNEIISRYPQVKLLYEQQRRGKSAALNRVVSHALNDILIFSDANTILNREATRFIARHYLHPSVGGVAGEKKVIPATEKTDQVGAGEGLYWKYESFLKQLDSDFYSVVGAAGELFSLRKELYEAVDDSVILDDFVISMKVAAKGYRVIYEPEAFAMELPSFSMKDEQKRKIRIAAGGFQAMTILAPLISFWKQPALGFLYFSHRVLRWTLSPLGFILAFVSNAIIFFGTGELIYKILFIGQLVFYAMALVAAFFTLKTGIFKLFRLAYYFVFMNLSVVQGFLRFLRGKQPAAWEKAKRSQ